MKARAFKRNALAARPVSSATRWTGAADARGTDPADVPEWSQGELLKYERELTGFYIRAHPLARYEATIQLFANSHDHANPPTCLMDAK